MRLSTGILLSCLALFSPLLQAGHDSGAQVKIHEVAAGEGIEAAPFSSVEVHYTGRLTDGTVFDSSVERGQPFGFTLGGGQVIPGWELGIRGMKKGGTRVLTIPPELGLLTDLDYLQLQDNQLTGTIPSEIGNLTGLRRLWLHGNRLTGELPGSLINLTALFSSGFNIS